MTRLENAYRQKQDETMAEKDCDEADDLVEQIDRETMPARSLLASLTKVKSRASLVANSEASQRRKEKERAEVEARLRRDRLEWEIQQNREELERQDQEPQAVNEEIIKRRQELEDAIEEELGIEKEVTEEFRKLPSHRRNRSNTIKKNRRKNRQRSQIKAKNISLISTTCTPLKHHHRKCRNHRVLAEFLTLGPPLQIAKHMGN